MPRLSRYKRVEDFRPVKIGRPKHLCLMAVGRYHYLTAEQITRLVYGTNVLTYVQKHLMELYHARYLQRVFLPTLTPHGSSRAFYCLDNQGYAYLRAQRLAPEGRFRASEQAQRHWLFLKHTEASNDLMILAQLFIKTDPRVTITRFKTERELKQSELSPLPDGWLVFQAAKVAAIAFELDRDTMERRDWFKKLNEYGQAIKGSYIEAFGTSSLTLAIVTTEGERRLTELLNWTEDHLRRVNDATLAQVSLFAAFNPASADPGQVFTEPIWNIPFNSSKHPLLESQLFTTS